MKKQVVVFVAFAAIPTASAQSVVYTNIVNGRPQAEIVRVVRQVQPAAAIPSSIETTLVLPSNYRRPLGATSYVPPVPSSLAATQPRPVRAAQPWFVNGLYVGASPSGNWTSTVIGRPTIDVNIVSTPRSRTTSSSTKEHR